MASRSDIEAGKAHVTLYANKSPLVRGLKEASAMLSGLGTHVMHIGSAMAGLGAAIVTPIMGAVASFVSMGSELADVAARTGLAASNLAELKFAAEQTGASLTDVEAALRKMAKGGLDVNRFDEVAASIAAIPDPTERAARALETFGKSGTMLLPMLADLKRLRDEARASGLVPTEQAVAAADKLGDTFDKIRSIVKAVAFEIGAALAPVLQPALQVVAGLAVWFRKWASENGQVVRTVAMIGAGLLVAGTAVAALGAALAAAGAAVGGIAALIPVLAAIGPALLIAVGVVAALGAALATTYAAMRTFNVTLTDLFTRLNAVRGVVLTLLPSLGLVVALAGPLGTAFNVASSGLQLYAHAALAAGSASMMAAQQNRELADSFDEIGSSTETATEALLRHSEAAAQKRQRLRDEFLTPEERGQRKEKEIFAAKNQVNRNRVMGTITEQQAGAEQRGLDIALARHRANEAERRRREQDGRRPVKVDDLKLPVVGDMAQDVIKASQEATVTFSGSGLLAAGQGSGGPGARQFKAMEDQLKEARQAKELLKKIEAKLVPQAFV